ncbi:ATP-binding protein [Bacteroides sp. UBA939]|uniref:hybrid sensor histidine kinase/response regulator transcription factor n=1 Tax=Bacteroides sp. UBA939 TaxID=1946092 RepID=UPI0025BACB7A|nr:ATP-binding protein [Bacteroides sp. UBA939]
MKDYVPRTKALCILLFLGIFLYSCQQNSPKRYSPENRSVVDSIVKANPSIDSLTIWLQRYTEAEDSLGMMLVRKELGKRYREESRFSEAIEIHREGLQISLQLGDTLEAVQALNNIGTSFRRMGIMDEASNYHYEALLLCEQYRDKSSYAAKKNRVVSLNSIGNIHLTLDNRDAADSVFRIALAGERELNSNLGQAINYANLGAIFEARGMNDSALVYYRHSMEYNRAANSILGISLCYNHFGRLFEKDGKWEDALREYRNAYDLMEANSDRWHWLEACLALARVNISKGDITVARIYLERAKNTAEAMNSWEHLSEAYRLDYLCYEIQKDYHRALDSYTQSRAYADSVKNEANINHVQNLRVNYEKGRSFQELSLIREKYRMEQRTKNIFLVGSFIILFITVIAIVFLWYALRMKSRSQQMLHRMEKMRSNFFTNVTHEFRTPLTVILGLSEQLQKNNSQNKETETTLSTIVRQGRNLLDLVNQLLEVSKVKSEVGEPEWRSGDIVNYTRMIMENYQVYARQRRIELLFIPSETVIIMDFVPEYFRKIIRNLLSNAFKFTPKDGSVTVAMERKNDKLAVRISDTGCGISEEDLSHIFETFYQGENSKADIGTGIGLALVRQMVVCMNGEISVESGKGKGAEFTITIPLKHGETIWANFSGEKPDDRRDTSIPVEDEKILADATPATEEVALPSILIIEDNPDISYYIGGLLKDNYTLLYARDGEEGLEKAQEYVPDLIITDLMMPEMNGYELCREVRASEILNHIPIIIITAKCGEDNRIQGLDVGADAYLEKPFNADELNIRIVRLLEQRRMLREKYSNALHEGKELSVELSPADQSFLTHLNDVIYSMMSNHSLNSEMVAGKMCMSLSQLNRKIKAITGFNSSGYILQMRLDKAKRMLASTDTPVGDIALKCGFPEMSYFSRIFKQTFQMTPSQYRKKRQ